MFDKIGRFEVKGILGRGAMGEVYLGFDPVLGREVAIKTILPANGQGEEAKRRFSREAKAAAVLNHPNIVTIYEFGEDQGVLYIVMERVKGQDFAEMLLQQSVNASEGLELLAQVCDGLEFAHRNHIIHRDIKPSNIRVLRDGPRLQVKVMDFGVARIKDSEMTASGTVVGTVSYMAPEYIRTGKPDARSDLFAVGVMLYECISGRRPFEGETTATILYRIVNESPDPVDLTLLKDISPALRSVLDTALAKDPDHRYQTAGEFAQVLRAAKNPTWQGHVDQSTISLGSKASEVLEGRSSVGSHAKKTVPGIAIESHNAKTAAISEPQPRRSRVVLISVGFSLIGFATMISGGYFLYTSKRPKAPDALTSPGAEPAKKLSMEDTVQLSETAPLKALEEMRTLLAADPGNANLYAWIIAILYEQKRYKEIPEVFAQSQQNGVSKEQMMNNVRYRMAMHRDKLSPRIPGGAGIWD